MRTTSTLSRRALGASLAATLAALATAACTTGGGGQNEPATGSIQQRSGTGTGGGIRGPQVGAGG